MQFPLLYRYDPAGPGPVEGDVELWMALADDLKEAGTLVHETGFFPASEAVTVTVGADGTPTTTPGVLSGEPIAGYFTIDVAGLDEAIAWAGRLPVAGKGTVEVRRSSSSTADATSTSGRTRAVGPGGRSRVRHHGVRPRAGGGGDDPARRLRHGR